MENERETLEEKVDELRKRLERLEEEWETYQARISRMMTSKLADPRHPLTDWELVSLRSEAEVAMFRKTMTALQNRLLGKTTPENERIAIEGIDSAVLYAPTQPSIDEVVNTLKTVARQDDAGIIEVMNAAKNEFCVDYDTIADFVLEGVRFK